MKELLYELFFTLMHCIIFFVFAVITVGKIILLPFRYILNKLR
ncbi:MAG: hypothetical protein KQ78_01799 [Candidatus Izimaplasma bacterium HR2]|nr:MAG: hypothetical protein KQ78_01799 [Candidatus Izimaplasma bacterium HR2]